MFLGKEKREEQQKRKPVTLVFLEVLTKTFAGKQALS